MNLLKKVFLIMLITICSCCCKDEITKPEEIIDPDDPVADAGENQTINIGSYFVLDGSKSTKGIGDTLIYKWEQDENNPEMVSLYDNSIRYEMVSNIGIYKYSLIVNNGIKDSKKAELVINVNPRLSYIIEDPSLEADIRFNISKQTGQLLESDLLVLDSIRTYATVGNYKKIKTINGIELCKNLRVLILSLEDITDLSPLSTLSSLERLDIDQNHNLSNITAIASLTQLKHLNIDAVKINNISFLASLTNLEYLNILFTQVQDISVVSNFSKLKQFWAGDLPITDLTYFGELKDMELLYLTFSKVKDISALTNLTNLRQIEISENEISDISSLVNNRELFTLRVTDNNIKDIAVLEHLEKLTDIRLSRNKIEDIEPLVKNKGIGEGVIIELVGNPLNERSLNEYIPQLVEKGAIILL